MSKRLIDSQPLIEKYQRLLREEKDPLKIAIYDLLLEVLLSAPVADEQGSDVDAESIC